MKNVLLAGGRGLIGRYLTEYLLDFGYEVRVLTRNPRESHNPYYREYGWDPSKREMDNAAVVGIENVVNLAGADISRRWTRSYITEMLNSRTDSTHLLCNALKARDFHKLIQFSGIGYYGDHGEEWIDEYTPYVYNSSDVLAYITKEWEESAAAIDNKVLLRVAPVLTPKGGMVEKIKQQNSKGVIGTIGSGDQYIPWIHIEDLCRMVHSLMQNEYMGVLNAASPQPQTFRDFMSTFASVFHLRGIKMKIPDSIANAVIGPMTYELKKSMRAHSRFAETMGFEFLHKDLRASLESMLPED